MWVANGNDLKMAEGDWGVELPITISGVEFTANDVLKLTFKKGMNTTPILEQTYTPENNAINLVFTEAESELFTVGTYVYALDWYQDGLFLCNVIPCASLRVVDKA